MPRKRMRAISFQFITAPFYIPRRSCASPSNHRLASGDPTVDQIIKSAAVLVMKWNTDGPTYSRFTSLFHHSRSEAAQYILCVGDLQKAMHFLFSQDSNSPSLVQAHGLLQIAMKRLQQEFYHILSTKRAHLNPEAVSSRASTKSSTSSDYEDDGCARAGGDLFSELEQDSSIAMEDLKSIAQCMISSGYTKECARVYKILRKSVVDEGIYRLGVERLSASQLGKMDWESIDLKIKRWLKAVKIAMRTLFTCERFLCDHVFASSDSVRETCFANISRDGATILFGIPQIFTRSKKSPDKLIFRLLDMYMAISQHLPEIESIFSHESTSSVRSQALTSLLRIGDSVRTMLADFESAIKRDSSKSSVPDCGVHELTRGVMDHLTLLAEHKDAITDIFFDYPPPSLPESYSDNGPASAVSVRVAWIVLILLCKLDCKAEQYKDASMSYLFLANNLQHVLARVRASNLQYILGEDWIAKHEAKVGRFAANYERLGWGQVFAALPRSPTAEMMPAEELLNRFQSSLEQAFRKHSVCVISDPKLRDEIKVSIARKVVPVYREFYDRQRVELEEERNAGLRGRLSAEDIVIDLSGLFFEMAESESWSSVSSLGLSRREILR